MLLLDTLSAVARELLSSVFLDYALIPVYVVVILLIRTKYIKYIGLHHLGGDHGSQLKQIVEETVLFGMASGFIFSVVLVYAGFTMNGDTVKFLLIIILLLSVINTRFICFSYAAGIIAIISTFFRLPGVNASSLLLLAALLHFIESGFIFFDRGRDSIPVFISYNGAIAGAYLTRKFWPVPIVFLTTAGSASASASAAALAVDCIIGVLAYSDIAVTESPEMRSRQKARWFLAYSAVLLVLALVSFHSVIVKILGAVFAIGGHEAIVLYGQYREKHGKPLFKAADRGLRIFDILPGSHAELMGLKRGDIILNINGSDIQTERGITEALKNFPTYAWVRIIDAGGNEKTCEYRCFPNGFNDLGIVSVPRDRDVTYRIDYFESLSILRDLVARFRKGQP